MATELLNLLYHSILTKVLFIGLSICQDMMLDSEI